MAAEDYIDPDEVVALEELLRWSGRTTQSFCVRFGIARLAMMPTDRFVGAVDLILKDARIRGMNMKDRALLSLLARLLLDQQSKAVEPEEIFDAGVDVNAGPLFEAQPSLR